MCYWTSEALLVFHTGAQNPHQQVSPYFHILSPPLDWLYDSLLSTCSWCVVSAYTWLTLWLSLLSTCSWCVVRAYTWLALWLSLLSTCSWCVVRAYTWLSLWLSLLSTCTWCVVRAYTWLALWLSLLSTCSWCVMSAYTWLALWLSLLSTCSWCVVSALASLYCGSCRIIQVDAAVCWWWLRRDPPHPHMIVKCFGCTTIHLHLHLHLVIWQTLLSKATYNWGVHKAINLEEANIQRKCQ